jgi:hypothetical protein
MKTDLVYLRHITDSITKIESYATVGKKEFVTVSHWQDAIIRNLEIIGEATKRISRTLKERYTDIPWRNIAVGEMCLFTTIWGWTWIPYGMLSKRICRHSSSGLIL